MTTDTEPTAPLVQQIFRVTEDVLAAFRAEAEACGMPLAHWYVQSLRHQAGLPAFTPKPRAARPAIEPPAEPKRRGRPPIVRPEGYVPPPRKPRGPSKPKVKPAGKLATLLAGIPKRKRRAGAQDVKP